MDWDFGDVFLSMMVFFFWMMFISMFISAFMDVFRRRDLSGWGKAGWTMLMVIFPFFGILVYMIARPKPTEEELAQYSQVYGARPSAADEIARLADLHQKGELTDEEYTKLKQKVAA